MILLTVFVISGYCIDLLIKNGPRNEEFHAVNKIKLWDMVGFSFYCFEGIGVVLPIMEQTRDKQNFEKVLTAALLTLACIFAAFGFMCYRYFGHQKEKFVIYNFDDDPVLNTTELLFCLNLVFSYPLCIYPTNKIIESFLFVKMKEVTTLRKWLKNLSRTIIVFLGCYFSILFKESLDDFLGVTGAVLGISIILIIPTLCHYKTCAQTKGAKI